MINNEEKPSKNDITMLVEATAVLSSHYPVIKASSDSSVGTFRTNTPLEITQRLTYQYILNEQKRHTIKN